MHKALGKLLADELTEYLSSFYGDLSIETDDWCDWYITEDIMRDFQYLVNIIERAMDKLDEWKHTLGEQFPVEDQRGFLTFVIHQWLADEFNIDDAEDYGLVKAAMFYIEKEHARLLAVVNQDNDDDDDNNNDSGSVSYLSALSQRAYEEASRV